MKLSQSHARELFDYNSSTGKLYWKVGNRRNVKAGDEAGHLTSKGYLHVNCRPKPQYAHRIIWLMAFGAVPDDMDIDHIDGNPLNNRIQNLRLVSHQENMHNMRRGTLNTSGHLGVQRRTDRNLWRVYINVNGRENYVGSSPELEVAIAMRKYAERKHGYHPNHGRVVRLEAA